MSELKPCPFCGSESVVYLQSFAGPYIVKCQDCKAIVSFRYKPEKDKVIDAWNQRSTPDARETD